MKPSNRNDPASRDDVPDGADGRGEGSDRRPLGDAFERLWSQALAAVSGAEEEVGRFAHRAAELAGSGPEEARRQVRELSERLGQQRKELERRVEDGIRGSLARMRIPRREQLQRLERRLDEVTRRLEALAEVDAKG